jgi:hypothetical protein
MPQSVYTKTEVDSLISGINTKISNLESKVDTADNEIRHRLGVLELANQPPTSLTDTFSTVYNLTDGQTSPDGKWKLKYVSGGKVYSDGQILTMYPKTVTSIDQTASTLLLSIKIFKDYQLDVDMKTNKQLRTGSSPKTWETGWIFFDYTDEQEGPLKRSNHHRYVVLHTNKFEFGKKDNKPGDVTNEQQIFLKIVPTPFARVGVSDHITIIKKGIHITIKVNNVVVVDMDDTPNDPVKMAQGQIGLYEEDSSVSFDNVNIKSI